MKNISHSKKVIAYTEQAMREIKSHPVSDIQDVPLDTGAKDLISVDGEDWYCPIATSAAYKFLHSC